MMTIHQLRNPKICLLGATFETGNMGVSALTVGAIKCILHRFPDASICLLDYGKTDSVRTLSVGGREVRIDIVNMRFSKKFYLRNNIALLILISLLLRLVPGKGLRKRIMAGNPCLRRIDEADRIASIAAGDSFSDIYGLGRLLYVSLPQFLVLFLRKKLLLLPQTFGPFRGAIARAVAKYILTHAEVIYSRDYLGLKEIAGLAGSDSGIGNPRFCYDVAFVLDPVAPAGFDQIIPPSFHKINTSLVGLNVSGLLFMGGYTQNNMFGLKVEYEKLIYRLIEFFVQRKKADVLLIPHVFGSQGESDAPVCENIYETLKEKYEDNLGVVRGSYDQSEIKHIIGRCDFFIGSRMHSCIAALSQNIPAVAIAYSDKFIGVLQTIEVESLVVDARKEAGVEEILKSVNDAYDRRNVVREALERKMPHVKQTVLNLFHEADEVNSVGGKSE